MKTTTKMSRFNSAVSKYDRASGYALDKSDVWALVVDCERRAEKAPPLPELGRFNAGFWYRLALELQTAHAAICRIEAVQPVHGTLENTE